MCKMTGHVYLVDGGVQNDHAQPGPLKVNTACWEGGSCTVGRVPRLPTRPGLHEVRRGGGRSVWVTVQLLYHGMLWQGMRHA